MSETDGKWQNLIELITLAQERVRKEHGIELIPEVQIIQA